ncbi:hypothetical protein Aconfl_35890 [Algoriphagus confluentis]|uniref:Uncharacterized protein n=1 Tax=Algoriphagus confluentis TaxID=1697556 RepID=A0ABQ6PTI1_9BACT|nr:hypothetical protein Aconfl_35890 [Algoriphagus confluentis]
MTDDCPKIRLSIDLQGFKIECCQGSLLFENCNLESLISGFAIRKYSHKSNQDLRQARLEDGQVS